MDLQTLLSICLGLILLLQIYSWWLQISMNKEIRKINAVQKHIYQGLTDHRIGDKCSCGRGYLKLKNPGPNGILQCDYCGKYPEGAIDKLIG